MLLDSSEALKYYPKEFAKIEIIEEGYFKIYISLPKKDIN